MTLTFPLRIFQRATLTLLTICGLLLAAPAAAFDAVYPRVGQVVSGTITAISKDEVSLQDRQGIPVKLTIVEIRGIRFDREPSELANGRAELVAGEYAKGLKTLATFKPEADNPRIKGEVQYYLAYGAAKLALAGRGEVKAAGAEMAKFLKDQPDSWHTYEATELVGDLLRASGNFAAALTYYEKLKSNKALAQRGLLAIGWTHFAQDQFADATKAFDQSIAAATAGSKESDQHKMLAQVGKAGCQGATNKTAEAIKQLETIIKAIDHAKEPAVAARTYNVLGGVYRAAKQPKPAALAYLHVDLLYAQDPAEHAEALGNLSLVWAELSQTVRSRGATTRLKELYPSSRWSK